MIRAASLAAAAVVLAAAPAAATPRIDARVEGTTGVLRTTSEPAPAPVTRTATTARPECAGAEAALRAVGATEDEIRFAIPVAWRESRCTLDAVNQSSRTKDDSHGPWQINYFGALIIREQTIGPRESNTADWVTAAANFLALLRDGGRCHWQPPAYCAGS